MRENLLTGTAFEPTTFQFSSSRKGVTSITSITLILLAASTLWDLEEVTKQPLQSLCIQYNWWAAAAPTTLYYQDHLSGKS